MTSAPKATTRIPKISADEDADDDIDLSESEED
jgi:hypothetical protein